MSTPQFDANGVVPAIHIDAEYLPSVALEIANRLASVGEALFNAGMNVDPGDPATMTVMWTKAADIGRLLSLLGQIGWPISSDGETYDGLDLAVEMFDLARRQLPRLSDDDPVRATVEPLLSALGEAIGDDRLLEEQRFARGVIADIARDSAECVANIARAPGRWDDPEGTDAHYGHALAGAKQALAQLDAESMS